MMSIQFEVAPEEAEFASGLLWALGVSGIEERDIDESTVLLVAGFEDDLVASARVELEQRWSVEVATMDYEAYLDAWRPYATAVRVSERLVIQPPWVDPIATDGDLVVSVDPGRSWGHGAHPATVLCAQVVDELGDLSDLRVLDVGCGSGVLSITAALCGAQRVEGIDIDAAAIEATLANASASGVTTAVTASTTPLGQVKGTFDVVLANIGLATLVELAPVLSRRVDDRGVVVLSGLLVEQVDDAVGAYNSFVEIDRRDLDGWAAVTLRR